MIRKINGEVSLGKPPKKDLDIDAQGKLLPPETRGLVIFLTPQQQRAYLTGTQAQQVELLHAARLRQVQSTRT